AWAETMAKPARKMIARRMIFFIFVFVKRSSPALSRLHKQPKGKVAAGFEVFVFSGQLAPVGIFIIEPRIADHENRAFAVPGGRYYHGAVVVEQRLGRRRKLQRRDLFHVDRVGVLK